MIVSVLEIIGALGVFLYGMRVMSGGIQIIFWQNQKNPAF